MSLELVHQPVHCGQRKPRAAGDGGLPGTIKTLLFLGSQWVVNVSTALGDIHISLPNARRAALHEGAEVSLNWTPEDVRVLTQQEASRG